LPKDIAEDLNPYYLIFLIPILFISVTMVHTLSKSYCVACICVSSTRPGIQNIGPQ